MRTHGGLARQTLVVIGLCAASVTAVPASAGPATYLAIGDSLAFGYSTFLGTPIGFGDQGYVSRYADHLGSRRGVRPEVLNFAVPGDGVGEYDAPPGLGVLFNRNYYELDPFAEPVPTQRELVLGALDEHAVGARTITNVTVQLGVNDLLGLTDRPGFFNQSIAAQIAEAQAGLVGVAAGYELLLGELVAALPGAEIVVMGYYNPFPARPGDPLAPIAEPVLGLLNGALSDLAADAGVDFVDLAPVIRGREAELTRIQTDDALGGANIHPTEAGYDAIAGALIAVPSPGAGVVLALAGVSACRRRR